MPASVSATNALPTSDDPEDWADVDLGSPESHQILPNRAKSQSHKGIEDGEDPLPEI